MTDTSEWGYENAELWKDSSKGGADEDGGGNASDLLLLSSASSILVDSIREKFHEAGYTMDEAAFDIDAIRDAWGHRQAVVICFVDNTVQAKTLVYINDLQDSDPRDFILIGSVEELHEVEHFISEEAVSAKFVRPVDVNEVVTAVEEFLKNPVTKKKHIALCDDDRAYRKLITHFLSPSYDVENSESGMELLSQVVKRKPDLILLDYEMPVADGPMVLKMLRADASTAEIPVIFLTGNSDRKSVMEVLSPKPEGYLLKSMPGPEIKLNIDAFFRKKRHQHNK